MTNTYIAIDLETTGLSAKLDKIIEIGAVKFTDGKETDVFSTYVNPGIRLPERIIELTGIRDADVEGALDMEDLLEELDVFLGEEVLLGHNLLFDFSFLKKAFSYKKRKFEKTGIDTLKIARACLPQMEHKGLGDLCAFYKIPLKAHRAVEDARAAGLLYQRLTEHIKEKKELEKKISGLIERRKDAGNVERKIDEIHRHIEDMKQINEIDRSVVQKFIEKIIIEKNGIITIILKFGAAYSAILPDNRKEEIEDVLCLDKVFILFFDADTIASKLQKYWWWRRCSDRA